LVNVIEYWQTDKKGKIKKFSWVTDIPVTEENVFTLIRAGRARWKIENETFNTLKNQGYNLDHNYWLGKKNLSAVFTVLTMLAFLIDQVQQLSCWLFQEALQKTGSKLSRSTINDGRFFTQNDGEQYLLSSFWGFTPNPKVFLGM
jgi:hypothetical protein